LGLQGAFMQSVRVLQKRAELGAAGKRPAKNEELIAIASAYAVTSSKLIEVACPEGRLPRSSSRAGEAWVRYHQSHGHQRHLNLKWKLGTLEHFRRPM
jgi:hypothetical protein